MKKILISGGESKFAKSLISENTKFDIKALSRSQMDVTNFSSIKSSLGITRPDYFIHTAALSRPMILHKEKPDVSIKSNIIGTANCVLACMETNVKFIYISTDFVYPGTDGNYCEDSALLPINEYAWSKLGGECSVKLYDNSLIIRTAMVENPYPHKKAFVDVKKSLIEYKEAARLTLELLDQSGIVNLGKESDTIYNHVKKIEKNIGKISRKDITNLDIATDSSMNIDKLKRILNDKSI